MIQTNAVRVDAIGGVGERVSATATQNDSVVGLADTRLRTERRNDTVYVRGLDPRPGYSLRVEMPAAVFLIVNSEIGNVRVSHVARARVSHSIGNVTIDTVGGDLEVTHLMGELRIRDVQGDIAIPEASGSLEIRGVSKNVTIDQYHAGDIHIINVLGNVRIRSLGYSAVDVQRVSGDLTLDRVRPPGASSLTYSQVGGRVTAP
jgi:hypothetical protein